MKRRRGRGGGCGGDLGRGFKSNELYLNVELQSGEMSKLKEKRITSVFFHRCNSFFFQLLKNTNQTFCKL